MSVKDPYTARRRNVVPKDDAESTESERGAIPENPDLPFGKKVRTNKEHK